MYEDAFSSTRSRFRFVYDLYHDFSKALSTFRAIQGPVLTFFGSGMVPEDHPYYLQTQDLARVLAEHGYGIMTGGGGGLMMAANEGATLAQGRSYSCRISLRSEEHQRMDLYHVERRVRSFWLRKLFLIRPASAFIVVPGGFGTLDEVFEVLTLLRTKKLKHKKLIFINRAYWSLLTQFIEERLLAERLIDPHDTQWIAWADSPEEVLSILERE